MSQPRGCVMFSEDALAGAREHGVPDLLLYRKIAEPEARGSREAFLERAAQLDLLENFIARWFRSADGEGLTAASHSVAHTGEFEEQLYGHLRALLERRAGTRAGATAIRWHEAPYRGLLSFDYEHAPVLFGRTRARNEMRELRRAAAHPVLIGIAPLRDFPSRRCMGLISNFLYDPPPCQGSTPMLPRPSARRMMPISESTSRSTPI